jgi:hypothetical protein
MAEIGQHVCAAEKTGEYNEVVGYPLMHHHLQGALP